MAERAMKHGGTSVDEQIAYAYRLATGTNPSGLALETFKHAYESELAVFRADAKRATKLLSIGEHKRDESLGVAEHAAMSVICSMILNLDATLTRG
jgi:hypothetical protein